MRALHLISSGGNYGAENLMLTLCTELERLDCETTVGVFRNLPKPNVDMLEHAKKRGLQHKLFNCSGRIDFETHKTIGEFIEDNQIDVVHTHGYKADIYGYAATRKGRAALVATCHSWTERDKGSSRLLSWYGLLDKAVLKRFDMVVAVSDPLGDLIRRFGIPQESVAVIPNGVDLNGLSSAAPGFRGELGAGNRPIVGMIGRLIPAKGPDNFLEAAKGILAEFPETLFVLVGDGPDRERLQRVVNGLAIGKNVIFTGQRTDMPAVHASLDVMVLPSLTEGLPMVVLESMAAGKAVVATEVGGIPSLIIPEKTGILIKPGDSKELETVLRRLLSDPTLRIRLGNGAQELIRKKYSSRFMAESYLSAYGQALSKAASRRVPRHKGTE